jgi:hypothetical protein
MIRKFLFAALTLSIISCSGDSEPNIQLEDPIIGEWRYFGSKNYAVSGDIFEKEAHSCYQKSTISFLSDGAVASMTYSLDGDQNCIVNENANENSSNLTWEKIAKGKYQIGSRVRDSIFFPNQQTMEMMSYNNFYDNNNDVEIDAKSDIYILVD